MISSTSTREKSIKGYKIYLRNLSSAHFLMIPPLVVYRHWIGINGYMFICDYLQNINSLHQSNSLNIETRYVSQISEALQLKCQHCTQYFYFNVQI